MARTALTVTTLNRAGVADPSATTGTADGHKVANDGRVWLEFDNANASPRIVTIQTPATLGPFAVEDLLITIPGSASRFRAGAFETAYVNRPSGTTDPGMFYLDYPAGQYADIAVRALKI